jgi:hypothetical protein
MVVTLGTAASTPPRLRDDPDTRERLERELEDQRPALDSQREALGC